MANGTFVSYLRVSTARQGASGLGLEAQRTAVTEFLNGGRWTLRGEFVEVESGANDARPKLAEALALCRLQNATLVIAKLDRLSRDAHFLMGMQKASVRFVCADMPEANELTIGLLAVVAQHERKLISARTKAALAAKKTWYAGLNEAQRDELRAQNKAVGLGGDRGNIRTINAQGRAAAKAIVQAKAAGRASDLLPIIADLQRHGAASLRHIARGLNDRGIPTARGGEWSAVQVQRVMARAAPAP